MLQFYEVTTNLFTEFLEQLGHRALYIQAIENITPDRAAEIEITNGSEVHRGMFKMGIEYASLAPDPSGIDNA